jgi:hypothetical protein
MHHYGNHQRAKHKDAIMMRKISIKEGFMMRKISILLLALLTVLSACSNKDVIKHNYYFEAENEDWKAGMPYYSKEVFTTDRNGNLNYESHIDSNLTITYIGDQIDFSDIKYVEITCKAPLSTTTQRVEYTDGPPKELSFLIYGAASQSHALDKDDVITVTIDMSGEVQTLLLEDN